jgi:hypothetical protein
MLKRLLLALLVATSTYAQVRPIVPNRVTYDDATAQIRSASTLTYLDSTKGAILTFGTLTGGSGYTNGGYNNVPLTGGAGGGSATASITVSAGAVTSVSIIRPGTGYLAGNTLSASNSYLGGAGSGFTIVVASVDIEHFGINIVTPTVPFYDNAPSIFANVNTFPTTSQLRVGDHVNGGSLNNYPNNVYGVLSVESYMTIVGSAGLQQQGNANQIAAEKQAMYLFTDSITGKHRIGSTRYDSSVGYLPLALEVAGNEVLKATTDPFVQWSTSFSSASPVSASGTAALRNNAGTLEVSQNGGAWSPIGTGGLSGIGTTNFITKWTSSTALGYSIMEDDGSAHIIPSVDVTDDLGTPSNRWRNIIVGNYVLLGTGTTDLSLANPFYAVTGNQTGFAVAGASANASTMSVTISNGTCSCLNAGRTGTGTYLPMIFSTNGQANVLVLGNQTLTNLHGDTVRYSSELYPFATGVAAETTSLYIKSDPNPAGSYSNEFGIYGEVTSNQVNGNGGFMKIIHYGKGDAVYNAIYNGGFGYEAATFSDSSTGFLGSFQTGAGANSVMFDALWQNTTIPNFGMFYASQSTANAFTIQKYTTAPDGNAQLRLLENSLGRNRWSVYNNGNERLESLAATAGTTTVTSPEFRLRGAYWTGSANQDTDAVLKNTVLTTTPTTEFRISLGNVGSETLWWMLGSGGYATLGNNPSDATTSAATYITVGNTGGFLACGAATNASCLSGTIVNGSYAAIAATRTTSMGTYLPLAFFANGGERMSIDTNATNAVCVWVGSALHRLTLSGGNFVDGGTC